MDKGRARDVARLRRERRALLRQLAGMEWLIRGTFLTRYATCARPRCACHRGRRHGPIACVAVSAGGRQRQHYVRQGQAAAAREGVRQYHRLLAVVDRITAINLQLLREGRLDERGERRSAGAAAPVRGPRPSQTE